MGTPVSSSSFVYDAVALFGFGEASPESVSSAEPGDIVIRYCGWSLRDHCSNAVVGERDLMWGQDWYDKYAWASERLPSGIYRLRVPVLDSNRKTFAEQEQLLASNEQTAQVVLVATAMLTHRLQTGENLLKNDWTHCKEWMPAGRVELYWDEGRLVVHYVRDGFRDDYVWLSSVRTS